MSYVLSLIAHPDVQPLGEDCKQSVSSLLDQFSLTVNDTDWLAKGQALDFFLDRPLEQNHLGEIADSLGKIDLLCQPTANRRKKLLVADMDSTIVEGETLDDLAEYAGLKKEVAAITERAMNGELKFRDALNERVAMLKGLQAEFLEKAMETVRFTPGARTLVQTMRANGAYCALVSGGFTYFTERIAQQAGFHEHRGNHMDIQEGQITGRVIEPIVTKETKLERLKTLRAEKGLLSSQTLAVGDGANDLPMLLEAGLGIAFHAKPAVLLKAHHCLKYADLTGLLFAQGYHLDEFVDPSRDVA